MKVNPFTKHELRQKGQSVLLHKLHNACSKPVPKSYAQADSIL